MKGSVGLLVMWGAYLGYVSWTISVVKHPIVRGATAVLMGFGLAAFVATAIALSTGSPLPWTR